MTKSPIQILEASEPFYPQLSPRKRADGLIEPGRLLTDVLYRVTKERHRDGRVRTVLRGRYMRELNQFEEWKLSGRKVAG